MHVVNAARARELGCHALADQALKIADTPHLGEVRTTKADGAVEVRLGWLPAVVSPELGTDVSTLRTR